MGKIKIAERWVGDGEPVYFIADLAANHDGSLERAKTLIRLAGEAGADAVKFQNFKAETIVSDRGFKTLGGKFSHQALWKKSVFETYRDASIPFMWTPELKAECDKAGVHYFSAPYDEEAVDFLAPFVPAYKVGSGDITWTRILERIASKGKPVLLATGASALSDVKNAVGALGKAKKRLVLMQCNTNYTGKKENLGHVNLNVLTTYRRLFPGVPLGLSDHTPGHAAVLGAVALGARVIEKHFTDDLSREGPDHPFSMTPDAWREMVERTRELEAALGDGIKRVEDNEKETVVLQRRAVRAKRDIAAGETLGPDDLVCLRPCPEGAIPPGWIDKVVGRMACKDIKEGEELRWPKLTCSTAWRINRYTLSSRLITRNAR